MSENDEVYFGIQDEAVDAALSSIPFMNVVFLTPLYDLKKVVDSEVDFILGGLFGQVIGHSSCLQITRNLPRPSPEQELRIHYRLFSRAAEYKVKIKQILRI